MGSFTRFLNSLPSVPVTITWSSLIQDMSETYWEETEDSPMLSPFNIEHNLSTFLATRECFFHSPTHEPVVFPTFHATLDTQGAIALRIYYAWNPPHISFTEIASVVFESDSISIQPRLSTASNYTSNNPLNSGARTSIHYFIGPASDWLS